MIISKTKFSNILWIIYAILTFGFSNVVFARVASANQFDSGYGLIVPIILFVVFTAIMIVMRLIQYKKGWFYKDKNVFNLNSLVAGNICLALGIGLRFFWVYRAHGVYMNYLLPFALWLIGSVFFELGLFRIVSPVVSLIFCIGTAFIPYSVNYCLDLEHYTYSYLITGILFFVFSFCIPVKAKAIWLFGLAGVFLGALLYFFSNGIVLFCLIPCIFLAKGNSDEEIKNSNKIIATVLFVLSTLIVYVITCCVYSILNEKVLLDYLFYKMIDFVPILSRGYIPIDRFDLFSGTIISSMLILGVTSGWLRKKSNQGTYIFGILCALIITSCIGLCEDKEYLSYFTIIIMTILAGYGIDSMLYITLSFAEEEEIKSLEEAEYLEKHPVKISDNKSEKDEASDEPEIINGVKMLSNPLPLPKKKKRSEMDYDYEVPDDADYDY